MLLPPFRVEKKEKKKKKRTGSGPARVDWGDVSRGRGADKRRHDARRPLEIMKEEVGKKEKGGGKREIVPSVHRISL